MGDKMLTKKQYKLLDFIDKYQKRSGISPSFEEMKIGLGLKSKSGIHRLVKNLEDRGFVRRLPNRARALEVIRRPEREMDSPKVPNDNQPGVFSNLQKHAAANDLIEIPLYGKIAAGTPFEALRDPTSSIGIPANMLGSRGDYYSLEVDGDSMINAGIYDGDTVIIERCEIAESGEIVVALVDLNEVTLKKFHKKGKTIALEPANSEHETRIFGPDRVTIQGKLVGLMRRY